MKINIRWEHKWNIFSINVVKVDLQAYDSILMHNYMNLCFDTLYKCMDADNILNMNPLKISRHFI